MGSQTLCLLWHHNFPSKWSWEESSGKKLSMEAIDSPGPGFIATIYKAVVKQVIASIV